MLHPPKRVTLEELKDCNANIWIYGWDETLGREKLFAVVVAKNITEKHNFPLNNNDDVPEENNTFNHDPHQGVITISLPHPLFASKYNHVTLIVSDLRLFHSRLLTLSRMYDLNISKVNVLPDKGYIIVRDFTAREMREGKNTGVVVKVYCLKAKLLSQIIENRPRYYFVEAFARYRSVIHCFFNDLRYNIFRAKGIISSARSIFRVIGWEGDFFLEHISNDDEHYPSLSSVTELTLTFSDDPNIQNKIAHRCDLFNYGSDGKKISSNITTITFSKDGKYRDGGERRFLRDIFEAMANRCGLIIVTDSNSIDVIEYLKERGQFHGMRNFLPYWKLNIKLDRNNLKVNEISTILSLIDESPSFLRCEFFFNVCNVTVSLLESFNQSVVFAPICSPFSSNSFSCFLFHEKIPGGLVLEPLVGKYGETVCLDFESLYPNIMINFGIIKGRVCSISKNEYERNKEEYNEHFHILGPFDAGDNNDDDDAVCFMSQIGSSPIKLFCSYLIEERHKKKSSALKRIVNCIYGLCAKRNFSLYSGIAAIMITKYGRFFLQRAIKFFDNVFHLSCLYGDTDSIFIPRNGYDSQHLALEYNKTFPEIKLKIEANFEQLILIRKKLYFGKMSNGYYKFAGFSNSFLSCYKKFLCGILSTSDETEIESRRNMMMEVFFENDNNNNNNNKDCMKSLFWNSYMKPLLIILKNEKLKNYQSLNYHVIRINSRNYINDSGESGSNDGDGERNIDDYNDDDEKLTFLNHVIFPSKYTKGIIWKNRGKNDNVIFARFSKDKTDGRFLLTLEDAPQNKQFRNLRELENGVLLPLLGMTELKKSLLYIHPVDNDHCLDDFSILIKFLSYIYNAENIATPPPKNRRGGVCFVLPYDVLRI